MGEPAASRINVDAWLSDERPVELEIDGRVYRGRPVTFNQALQVASLTASMGSEYLQILQGEPGEQSLVGNQEANRLTEALLSKITFEGLLPDRIQRRRIARRLARKPIIVRILTVRELAENFTDYLRTLLAPLLESASEVSQTS